MVDPLRSFIEKRRSVLEKRADELRKELAQISTELDELTRVASAMPMVKGLDSATNPRPSQALQPGTIKDYAVQVLRDHPRGLVALDVLAAINRRFGTNYPRTSLSPQLSRLGQAGVLGRRGLVWYLVDAQSESEGALDEG
jgi:hypothetical protein